MFDIKKQLLWAKLRVGVVITLALFSLLVTVFFAGGLQTLFTPKAELIAQIQDVKGLRKGSPVWIHGIEVGSVKSIDLHPMHGTILVLSIDKSALQYVKKDSRASILTMGLLGDKYVEVTAGSPQAEPVRPGDMIKGMAQLELKDAMEIGTASIQRMSDFIDSLQKLVARMEKGEGTIPKLFTDPTIYNELKETAATLMNLSRDIKNSQGTLKKLIEDPTLYDKMLAASSSLEDFGKTLNRGEGSLKRFVENPELYENLNRTALQLSVILERIDKGEGVAGSLIRDQELARELKETVSELRLLTQDIKDHPKKYFKFSLF